MRPSSAPVVVGSLLGPLIASARIAFADVRPPPSTPPPPGAPYASLLPGAILGLVACACVLVPTVVIAGIVLWRLRSRRLAAGKTDVATPRTAGD